MAAPPARARADYDYLIKLLLIGDSGLLLLLFDILLCLVPEKIMGDVGVEHFRDLMCFSITLVSVGANVLFFSCQ